MIRQDKIMDGKIQERYIDGFCAMLKSDKLRCTSIRENILRIFFLHKHLCVDDILNQLHLRFDERTTKVTIYSTLKLLLSYKIIRKHKENSVLFYELFRYSEHFHLLCSSCGTAEDFLDTSLKTSIDKRAFDDGFKVNNMEVTIYGLCKKCNIDNE